MLNGKVIVLGVTGGIAAYKAATLCSRLVQRGADVHVIMTESAKQFIPELTLQTLTKNPVYSDTFDERDPSVVSHIHLADLADLVLIAPATANVIGKMAHGLADDMLTTTLLATTAPVMISPAMNVHMYTHPAVMANMETLVSRGVAMIEPGEGLLACGYVGKGRMEEPDTIVDVVERFFNDQASQLEEVSMSTGSESLGPLQGKKVVVTAGGTVERIDPVRYITNDSSGKMGFAIAKAAQMLGADVRLIAAHTDEAPPEGISTEKVESAQEMYEAVLRVFENSDIVVKAAAVADYRPAEVAASKIKKRGETMTLELVKTTDILESLGRRKISQFLIGFAAETDSVEQFAQEKLKRKNCDLIVANDVTQEGAGFGTDTNSVHIFDAEGLVLQLPVMSKEEVALRLLTLAAERLPGRLS
ncbi:bifunctional phosphopantothenoylcysteine decarboxylase/phosphopantothenate--cysteine ligase CoaBC [Paenibacillus glucanolyticus]|jgi:phosphopantothenoylcysteine decarboxylase/phosphopantothenate--cysteine ligase|uniref:bifunctional phosphopantothenoylcysteine decarboxylase/phosphopantothenate--cysteine ligase CoaBC n=1 Tax=Paenibacillus TaxID=44249 RepID=UPI0003E1E755|nr:MULTISPECIES: bifunctional phosphopantothenoylcysteine decarboxylase/phosphopantothenate--cysteine ligase CoaBC [Paenibacillus]ANA81810.1 phosphopantothenoylcysteine decarboxylase [Paenibacillus glucanolyticus]AVV59459.1 bifunctional phosphopantothenoylcysteine decarboxylase/phosphopantothenate--cysteine ligase CoaBC [Paenibacillus glucanolyticus]ETT43227.1 phosphopantothenoylcysteine decarboxylase/phosphopantothenate/cysteine ligase [Paenibacillus sp. FSL R5-808]